MEDLAVLLKQNIRTIMDFPAKGVAFRDLTTIWKDRKLMTLTVKTIANRFKDYAVDKVAGIEARGFITGAQVAYELGAGFIPIRKAGKLPGDKVITAYSLEYGEERLELHKDSINKGEKILIIDDILATGGTASAAIRLIKELGGVIAGLAFIAELSYLNGLDKLKENEVYSIVKYRSETSH